MDTQEKVEKIEEPKKVKKEHPRLKKFFNEERMRRILPVALLSFGLSFMLFFASPFEIFCNNADQFIFGISDVIGFWFLYFFCGFIFFAGLLFVLPKCVYKPFYAFFVAFFLMIYIQSNFMDFMFHSLPGDDMQEAIQGWYIAIDVILWAIVFAAIFLLIYLIKKQNIIRLAYIVLTIALISTQLVSVLVSSVSSKELNKSMDNMTGLTTQNLTTVSENNNIFIFCIDRFDGELYAAEYYKSNPEVFQNMKGFTYFKDNVAIYGHTYPAVVNMLTGIKNEHGESESGEGGYPMLRSDYMKYAYENNQTLKVLADEGYLVNVYTDQYYAYEYKGELPEYIANRDKGTIVMRETQPGAIAASMVLMSIYRAAPILMNNNLGWLSSETINEFIVARFKETEQPLYKVDMKYVHDQLEESEFKTTEQNVFSFIHISGCHTVAYDDQWRGKGSRKLPMLHSIKNSFWIINKYLTELQNDPEVYKNATIIVTGDHAHSRNDDVDLGQSRLTGMFVKPSGVGTGDIVEKNAPVSHDDIWATVFASAGISAQAPTGINMFDVAEGDTDRVRYNYWDYHFTVGDWKQAKYEIVGSAWDFENNWKKADEKILKNGLYD